MATKKVKKVIVKTNGTVPSGTVRKVKRVKKPVTSVNKNRDKTPSETDEPKKTLVDFILGRPASGGNADENAQAKKALGYTQDVVPVEDISYQMIKTKDNRFIRIMEVEPSNYEQLDNAKRNRIIETFVRLFRICPVKVQFKTVTEHINVEPLVQNIRRINKCCTDPKIQQAEEDYVESLHAINKDLGIIKHYYIIFQYDGGGFNSSANITQIANTMHSTYMAMARVMENCGNRVIAHNDENFFLLKVLYNFYNRRTAYTEEYSYRFDRIWTDRRQYYSGKQSTAPDMADFIAPKGIDFKRNHDFFRMDGLYYTYMTVTDTGYPKAVTAGWLTQYFDYGVGVDVDFYIKRLPKETTRYKLQRISVIKTSGAMYTNDPTKIREMEEAAANSNQMLESLKNGDDVFECVTILTLWAKTPDMLEQIKTTILQDLKSKDVQVELAHYNCEDYLRMTAPLLEINNKIFNRNARNFLTTTLASTYNMTAYQLFDETGYCMGYNMQNGAVVAINNFNTGMFKNGNMFILGTSGAGKTFAEMFLARKQFLTGIGTYFILPVKGHEYKNACLSLNGSYIQLVPGSKDCINIMEIRPEGKYKAVSDEDEDTRSAQTQSLMTKKISSLAVWIQLLIPEGDRKITSIELNRFNRDVASLYGRFEINEDNNSIFDENGNLKPMPTIGDLYELLQRDSDLNRISSVLLPFVEGSCRNMNGQTNVDLSNRCLVFDVEESLIGEDLLPTFLYIAFDCAYDLVKADEDNFDAVYLDEVWKLMKTESCAKQVQKIVKLIRGYAGAAIMATQELNDFISDPGGFGKSVIANSEIKFVMQLKDEEVRMVSEMMHLTNQDVHAITSFNRGEGMIIANDKKVQVQIKPSKLEEYLFTTDLNVKRRLKAEIEKKGEQWYV